MLGGSLRVRLVLLGIPLVAALVAPVALWLPPRVDALSRAWMESRAEGIARAVAGASAPALDFDDPVAAATALAGLEATPGALYAVLREADGRPLATWGAVPGALPAAGAVRDDVLHVCVPVRGRVASPGQLCAGFSTEEYVARGAQVRALLHGVAGLLLLTALAGAWVLGSAVVQPLRRITDVARRIAAGEAGATGDLPRGGGAEAAALSAAFARMLDELSAQRARIDAMNQDLARRVDERTAELARTSAALQALRRTQEQLVVADRRISLGRLAAGVGHEINNPLAYVHANLGWITEELARLRPGEAPPPGTLDELARAVADAAQGTDRIRQIVRQLRTFSSGAEDDRREPVRLGDAMNAAVAMSQHEIRHRGRLVRRDGPTPLVHANPVRLAQVFVNLLVNAAQALPEGAPERSEVRVTVGTSPDGRAFAEVADTGCGIGPEDLGRLFDPFFTTKPVGVGTGLGLSISQSIVRALGGEIAVESAPGRGSVFRVVLPAWTGAAPEDAPSAPASTAPEPPRRRVLVIDDEPRVATALARALSPWHDVTCAAGGREALDRIAGGERFDRILCDLMMPEASGMELHAELARRDPALAARVVFMTGGAFTESAQAFRETHPGPFLEKPVDLDRLRRLLDELPS